MRNMSAVFLKQMKETLKNKTILIQFLMFPVMTIIGENVIKMEDMPEHYFAKMFAVMFVGMAPLSCLSSIISEEKEKDTLRALMMSNVKAYEYLLGVGSYVWFMCMIGALIFAMCAEYRGMDFLMFILIMAFGILVSGLIGAVIGIICKKQMSASSVTVPVMMVFSFLPMLAMFNETFEKIAIVTYSQQMTILINGIGSESIKPESIMIIAINFVIAAILFIAAYKKKGLE